MPPPTIAPTVGEIARRLGERLHRIEYVIRSRAIQPVARAGQVRVFTEEDVVFIADELRLIDAHQGHGSNHETPGTSPGGVS